MSLIKTEYKSSGANKKRGVFSFFYTSISQSGFDVPKGGGVAGHFFRSPDVAQGYIRRCSRSRFTNQFDFAFNKIFAICEIKVLSFPGLSGIIQP